MIKTLKSTKAGATGQDVIKQVRANARDVWLAGLGAFAAMQKEGSKVVNTTQAEGIKVYNALVKQGKDIEAHAKKAAVKRAEVVGDKTSQAFDKLEQVFQDRVSRSLNRLGVPTTEDVNGLTRRVEELTKNVRALAASKPARPAARKTARA
jgi:poly(hydroxyalkanoate) granule-associated protein